RACVKRTPRSRDPLRRSARSPRPHAPPVSVDTGSGIRSWSMLSTSSRTAEYPSPSLASSDSPRILLLRFQSSEVWRLMAALEVRLQTLAVRVPAHETARGLKDHARDNLPRLLRCDGMIVPRTLRFRFPG